MKKLKERSGVYGKGIMFSSGVSTLTAFSRRPRFISNHWGELLMWWLSVESIHCLSKTVDESSVIQRMCNGVHVHVFKEPPCLHSCFFGWNCTGDVSRFVYYPVIGFLSVFGLCELAFIKKQKANRWCIKFYWCITGSLNWFNKQIKPQLWFTSYVLSLICSCIDSAVSWRCLTIVQPR